MSVRTHLPASSPPWRDEQYGPLPGHVGGLVEKTSLGRVAGWIRSEKTSLGRRRTLSGWQGGLVERRRPLSEDVPCQKTSLVRRRTLSEHVPCQGVRVDP